jgi:hypothetical protein
MLIPVSSPCSASTGERGSGFMEAKVWTGRCAKDILRESRRYGADSSIDIPIAGRAGLLAINNAALALQRKEILKSCLASERARVC